MTSILKPVKIETYNDQPSEELLNETNYLTKNIENNDYNLTSTNIPINIPYEYILDENNGLINFEDNNLDCKLN